ncbi:MAG: hypothetical protein CL940_06740 [Deltaproteobacteria bacterium]|nr:hypothetical protein [Deltaproteobacteria bacterium]
MNPPSSRSLACVALATLCAAAFLGCSQDKGPPVSPAGGVDTAPPKATPEPSTVAEQEVERWLARRAGEQWYGVYALGSKVGHAVISARASGPGEPGGWSVGTEVEMVVKGAGRANTTRMTERNFYGAASPYALVASEMRELSGGSGRTRRLRAAESGWTIETTQGTEPPRVHEVAASEETLMDAVALMPSDLSRLRVGQESMVKVFDWLQEADTRVLVEVVGLERIQRAGVPMETARLAVTYESLKTTLNSVVAQGGVVLETSFGAGIELRLEEKDVARSGVEGLDVLGTAIPVKKKLGDPRKVTRLELAVSLPTPLELPNVGNQQVTPLEDGRSRVVLTARDAGEASEELLQEALKSDATMDADHPSVALLAKSFTERFHTPEARAEAIRLWVHENLAKELATHVPTASGVLARRVGDCTEHTWLFVALCRAAGLPARPVYGLMYLGDAQPSFGYHAWAEVALGGRWHVLDPTWNEAVADATHLRLGSGVHDVAGMIGRLKIEVLSSSNQKIAAESKPAPRKQ